jgi:UDP-GlcNAc:undecaprenyl-phosphate GlcNAc-1-phosphate transferase
MAGFRERPCLKPSVIGKTSGIVVNDMAYSFKIFLFLTQNIQALFHIMTVFLIAIILLFFLEILYFKIADHYNIIDKPNLRSSHTEVTLRGGGIIFPIAFIAGILLFEPSYWFLALGVFAIALISFLDDVMTLNNKIRIGVHLLSVVLILIQIIIHQQIPIDSVFSLSSLLLLLCSITVVIGIINAYNFMDGINGITVLYSLVGMCSLYYTQVYLNMALLEQPVFLLLIASLIVFGFFNLRRKAKAFAGDVGSISVALIFCFLILQLIMTTGDLKWLLFLGIYGLDSVATIFCRIIRRENIFDAHRSHFYQYLANEEKWSHTLTASLYAFLQLVLNGIIIHTPSGSYIYLIGFMIITLTYIIIRLKYEGKRRLFYKY